MLYFRKEFIAIALISASELALAENREKHRQLYHIDNQKGHPFQFHSIPEDPMCLATSGTCPSEYEKCESDIELNGQSLTFCTIDPDNCTVSGTISTNNRVTIEVPECQEDGAEDSSAPVRLQGTMMATMIFSAIVGGLALS